MEDMKTLTFKQVKIILLVLGFILVGTMLISGTLNTLRMCPDGTFKGENGVCTSTSYLP